MIPQHGQPESRDSSGDSRRGNGQRVLVHIDLAGLGSACFELFGSGFIGGMDENAGAYRSGDAAGVKDMRVGERSRGDKNYYNEREKSRGARLPGR